MRAIIQRGVLCIIFFTVSLTCAVAQVNTPAGATWPFGSRIQQFPANPYDFGIIPGNLPAGPYNPGANQFGASQQAYDAYVDWKNCYVVDCGGGQMRVRFDDPTETVSEGIAYGMLLAAYAADKPLFDGLWSYYLGRTNGNGFMNWHIDDGGTGGCGTNVIGANGAADADLDAAMALIVAACQWPEATTPYNYTNEAEYLISRFRQHQISTCTPGTNQISNGDGWIGGCPANHDCRNPSYQSPAYVRHFQAFDPGAPGGFWNTVLGTIYPLMNNNRNAATGLVSNWSDTGGNPNTCSGTTPNEHGYDAIRAPWRIATDYIWWGEAQARDNFSQPISDYIRTQTGTYGNPNNLRGPVNQNGNHNGNTTAIPTSHFTSMWGTAAMAVNPSANNQATMDFMYTRTWNVTEPLNCTGNPSNYFGMTLRVIGLFMMTGNFWKPCPPRCQPPVFAADSISFCGEASIDLNSGLPAAANRSFQWYKDNTSIGGATNPTLTVFASGPSTPNGDGWYKVRVDSAMTPVCRRVDSIYVSAESITPDFGTLPRLCDPISTTLNSHILGNGYTFEWSYADSGEYGDLQQTEGDQATLDVAASGLYRVRVSKAGCTTREDTITVTSSVVSPVDNCDQNAPASVELAVGGPNLGDPSLYDWYEVPDGGAPVETGSHTFTTPSLPAGTYTYYVQDNSKIFGSIGRPQPTNPPAECDPGFTLNPDNISASWGTDDYDVYSQTWTVNDGIDIDSVTVWMCLWSAADAPDAEFELRTIGGAPLQTTPVRSPEYLIDAPGSFGPPWTGRVVGVRYYVGFTNVVPGNYRVWMPSGNTPGNLLLEQHPTNVAYNYNDNLDGQTATITNSFGYSTTFSNRYAHFYDWTIGKVNDCERIPVTAYIGDCPTGLPVDLVDFSLQQQGDQVAVSWTTASEENSDYFVVERSSDGHTFEAVGTVQAAGTSETLMEYHLTDQHPKTGLSYYRLVQYDADGTFAYGPVESIYLSESNLVSVQPNPFRDQTTVVVQGGANLQYTLSNTQGQVVRRGATHGEAAFSIGAGIPSGLYILRVENGQHAEFFKLIKE